MDERAERGSILLMVPAALTVLLMLAGVAVDETVVMLAHRQLHAAAASAANDAVTAGVDLEHFNRTGIYRLDAARVEAAVTRSLGAQGEGIIERTTLSGPVTGTDSRGRPTVQVTLTVEVRLLFTKAVPGFAGTRRVTERATATAIVREP